MLSHPMRIYHTEPTHSYNSMKIQIELSIIMTSWCLTLNLRIQLTIHSYLNLALKAVILRELFKCKYSSIIIYSGEYEYDLELKFD